LEELIPEGDLCFVVSEVVEGLDLSEFEEGYSRLGRKGYHPRTLLKVMIYGYIAGVRSSRELEGRTETDVRYMWLAGRERPEHNTFARFRRRNLGGFEWLFREVLKVAGEMGILRLRHVAVDGTKVRASASWHRGKAAWELREEQERIEEEVKRILGEAEDADVEEERLYGDERDDVVQGEFREPEKRLAKVKEILERAGSCRDEEKINETDPQCRVMRTAQGFPIPGYNAQVAVDGDSSLIVACGASNCSSDALHLLPTVEMVEENTERSIETVTADAGYHSVANLEGCRKRGIEPILADPGLRGQRRQIQREEFAYDPEDDCFWCPEGKRLEFYGISRAHWGTPGRVYRCRQCGTCARAQECCANPGSGRTVQVTGKESFQRQMREKARSPSGRQWLRRHRAVVERVLAFIKRRQGLRELLLRGLEGANIELLLAATAYNIRLLGRHLTLQPPKPSPTPA
jgi:transposase